MSKEPQKAKSKPLKQGSKRHRHAEAELDLVDARLKAAEVDHEQRRRAKPSAKKSLSKRAAATSSPISVLRMPTSIWPNPSLPLRFSASCNAAA